MAEKFCKNYGDTTYPGHCLKTPDEQYTMDFTDVESGAYIYWCSNCGPGAHAMNEALEYALETRPGFEEKFKEVMEKVEAEQREEAH